MFTEEEKIQEKGINTMEYLNIGYITFKQNIVFYVNSYIKAKI